MKYRIKQTAPDNFIVQGYFEAKTQLERATRILGNKDNWFNLNMRGKECKAPEIMRPITKLDGLASFNTKFKALIQIKTFKEKDLENPNVEEFEVKYYNENGKPNVTIPHIDKNKLLKR